MAKNSAATVETVNNELDILNATPQQLKQYIGDSEENKETVLNKLREGLKTFGKGERATAAAKKVRRNLRALGFYISKQGK